MKPSLKEHLIRAGHLTETGLTRRARLRPCRRCGADTLVGLDADQCAFERHVDPEPLSALGEVLAVLEGRKTFNLARQGVGYVLHPRPSRYIAANPAGIDKGVEDVLRQHRCQPRPLTDAELAPSVFAYATTTTSPDDQPNF